MLKLPSNIEMDWIFILGGLAKLRKVNISFVMSVRPHWTTRLPQYRMSRNLTYWVFFDYTCIWVRKLDSDSLSETKNWSGRNEVIETSGRLHPSWPQSKRLRTPWTTDWMHTRQDGWIQTELVFTHAKNATKPNPFEIISLQTTKKENNWKTEETLERAVVTLETERIKGSNPWCFIMTIMYFSTVCRENSSFIKIWQE